MAWGSVCARSSAKIHVFLVILLTGGVDPDQEMIDLRMNAVKHKILILSGKGGNRLYLYIIIRECKSLLLHEFLNLLLFKFLKS